jgi:ribosomal protein L7/L12
LKIADIAMPVAAAPAAGTAAAAAASAPAADAAPEEAAPAAAEKAILTVKLESFEASAKAKVIREVKALLGCNLVEAKNLVEKAPTVLKENVVKEVVPLLHGSNLRMRTKSKKRWKNLEQRSPYYKHILRRQKNNFHPTIQRETIFTTVTPRVHKCDTQTYKNNAMLVSTPTTR